jgi:hypothetical protein
LKGYDTSIGEQKVISMTKTQEQLINW